MSAPPPGAARLHATMLQHGYPGPAGVASAGDATAPPGTCPSTWSAAHPGRLHRRLHRPV